MSSCGIDEVGPGQTCELTSKLLKNRIKRRGKVRGGDLDLGYGYTEVVVSPRSRWVTQKGAKSKKAQGREWLGQVEEATTSRALAH